MTRELYDKLFRPAIVACVVLGALSFSSTAFAAPFGAGDFGADIPFGTETSLGIALGGNVNLSLAPNGSDFSGTGSTTVTVTSTDPVGYGLYMYANGNTDMTSDGSTIAASTNGTESPLSIDSWGYNTDGSTTNFLGLTTTPTLIKSGTGPFASGDDTTVTFGVLADATKAAGNYAVNVTYTAVADGQ